MNAKPAAPGPRYRALLQLLRTAETLWNASRVFFARWHLSPSQFNVLNLLRNHPAGLSQMELSRELIMHRSNMTGLIDRLEQRGLVVRTDSASDRRTYRVLLTAKGRKLVQMILPHYYQAAEQVWGRLPAGRSVQLAADLVEVTQNAERIAAAQAGQ
ncbi:MAG: MarR family transcriptional regulator [Verrucomicrobiota bacterium]